VFPMFGSMYNCRPLLLTRAFLHHFESRLSQNTTIYSNPQRGLECLQRALKLADTCTNANPADLRLFVSLLEDYLNFFEKNNPSITGNYITGLVALVQEHAGNRLVGDTSAVGEARAHFLEIVRFIKRKKDNPETSDKFSNIDVSGVPT
jgi:hypothetical protein